MLHFNQTALLMVIISVLHDGLILDIENAPKLALEFIDTNICMHTDSCAYSIILCTYLASTLLLNR